MTSRRHGRCDGGVLPLLSFGTSDAQSQWLDQHGSLPGVVEVSLFKNIHALTVPPNYQDLILSKTNVSFEVRIPREQSPNSAAVAAAFDGHTYYIPGVADDRLQLASFRADGDSISTDAWTLDNNDTKWANLDVSEVSQISNDSCRPGVTIANNVITYLYDFGAESKWPVVLDSESADHLALRETLPAPFAAALLKLLPNSFAVRADDRARVRAECGSCCVTDVRFRASQSPDFTIDAEFTLVGKYCEYDGQRITQRRMPLADFAIAAQSGRSSLKVHAGAPSSMRLPLHRALTFDFHPDLVNKGQIGASFGPPLDAPVTRLHADFRCPTRKEASARTQSERDLLLLVCGQPKDDDTDAATLPTATAAAALSLLLLATA